MQGYWGKTGGLTRQEDYPRGVRVSPFAMWIATLARSLPCVARLLAAHICTAGGEDGGPHKHRDAAPLAAHHISPAPNPIKGAHRPSTILHKEPTRYSSGPKEGRRPPTSSSPPLSVCRGTALAVICLTRQTDRQTEVLLQTPHHKTSVQTLLSVPNIKGSSQPDLRSQKFNAVALTFSAKHAAMHCGRHARDYRGLRGVHRERLLQRNDVHQWGEQPSESQGRKQPLQRFPLWLA